MRCKKAKCFFHSIEQNVFQPRTHRAHCAATAEKEAQQRNLTAVHPCTHEQPTHGKKIRTVPHHSQAPHKRRRGRQRTMFHFRTNLQTRNITPRASAKHGQKNGAPTSLYCLHKVLTTCAAREEERLPASLLPKPSFSSPPCTALFFFSAYGEKEEGCIPNKGMVFPKRSTYSKIQAPARRSGVSERNRPQGGS